MMVQNQKFLEAFQGTNTSVPVWFMRQAGRYLPEYQAIRKTHSLDDMFRNPELAAEITCQPVDIIGVDAAILFADILTLPSAMGRSIHFDAQQGPIIDPLKDVAQLRDFDNLDYVAQTIRLVKDRLQGKVPLIGFAGSPLTVATYLIEGGSSVSFAKTLRFMNERPADFQKMMECLTRNTIRYLKLQQQAGIDAYQIFDSWAGILPLKDFEKFILPDLKSIFASVTLPSLYFFRGAPHLTPAAFDCGADGLSVCHMVDLQNQIVGRTQQLIQGNLFNGWLYRSDADLRLEVRRILQTMKPHRKFIFNLSHGVFPDVNPDKLRVIVDEVRQFSW